MSLLPNLERTQKNLAEIITSSYSKGTLPQSILFSGPEGSSRMTGALDLAFLLLGNVEGRPTLSSTDLVVIPSRDLEGRKNTAINLFERLRTESARLNLIETIRLILFQYHGALAEAFTSTQSNCLDTCDEVSDLIYSIEDRTDLSEKEVSEIVKFLRAKVTSQLCSKGRRSSLVTVDEVRAIKSYFSQGKNEKVVILENIEGTTENAKNSLLKLLEEPEEHSHIIILSSNSQRMLQTLLSRLRRFNFSALSEKTIGSLIKSKFNIYKDYTSFEAFFFEEGNSQEERKRFEEGVKLFSSSIISGKGLSNSERYELYSSLERLNADKLFRECVAESVLNEMREGSIKSYRADQILRILNEWTLSSSLYNLPLRSSLDGILREAMDFE